MVSLALILFILAALGGSYLLFLVLRNKNTPKGVAMAHGMVAALGLIILIIYTFTHKPAPWFSVAILLLVLVGGLYLMYRDITGKPPKWLAIGHGIGALTGVIALIVFMFTKL